MGTHSLKNRTSQVGLKVWNRLNGSIHDPWYRIIHPRAARIRAYTAVTFWRAKGFEILRVYSFPEIIVLDLTNFLQNDRSSLISWLFSTKNYSYFTSSLFSVNFFSDGYMDHTKNPFWNYSFKFSSQHSCFVLCSTNSVTLGRKGVARKK